MATYVFENLTQAQANAITGADIIAFSTATATAGNVAVTISAVTDTIQNTTLTVGGKSLFFDAASLSTISQAGNLVFNDGSSLILGVNTADTLTGTAAGDTVYLFAGNDTFTGGAGASNIFAGLGNDTVSAGAGSSNLFGAEGNDSLLGGAGNDHLYGQSASGGTDGTDTITGGAGGDYINGNASADVIDGGADSDRIFGGNGIDTILGSAGNDTVNGNLGNDSIDGGADNDSLRGGQGDDVIAGGAGSDNLQGDLGTDTVSGGAGVDFATGGAGADVFGFVTSDAIPVTISSSTSYDTVNDYADGEDEFRITNAAGTSTFGNDTGELVTGAAGATFTTVSAATVYAQQLLDDNTTSTLYDVAVVKVGSDTYLFYDSDATGGTIDSIIKVQGVTDTSLFTIADFG